MVVQGGELTGYGNVANVRQTGGWVNNEGNLNIKGDYEINTQRGADAGFKAQFGNMVTVDGKAKLGGTLNLTGETKDGISQSAAVAPYFVLSAASRANLKTIVQATHYLQ